jgi:hypothetical protein
MTTHARTWPWRLENLSPTIGVRVVRTLTRCDSRPSRLVVIITWSTMHFSSSAPSKMTDRSRLTVTRRPVWNLGVDIVLPMIAVPSVIVAPTLTVPTLSSLE